jgi:hypothetical protein
MGVMEGKYGGGGSDRGRGRRRADKNEY